MDYRKDVRDDTQFKEDILRWHRVENDIAAVFQQILTKVFRRPVYISPTGCDMTGRYLEDKDVTTAPDFLIHFPGREKYGRHLEIKAAAESLSVFHFKVDQIHQYNKRYPGTLILMVRGTSTDHPTFTIFAAEDLEHKYPFQKVEYAGWGGKLCYRLTAEMFHWEPLVVRNSYPLDFFQKKWIRGDVVRRLKRVGTNNSYAFQRPKYVPTTSVAH